MDKARKGQQPLTAHDMRLNIERSQATWHNGCVACSSRNSHGLQLEFWPTDDGRIEAAFACDAFLEGYDRCLHGGVIATLLDAAMTNCMFARGLAGVTGELTVRFNHPVEIDTPARICAWVDKSIHWLHIVRSELIQNGTIKASAVGKFVEWSSEREGTRTS